MSARGSQRLWRVAAALLAAGAGLARGQGPAVTGPAQTPGAQLGLPGVQADALAGLEPLRVPVQDKGQLQGYIDWSARRVVAVGRSLQKGPTASDILMARRAAGVIALRNALGVSVGVRIGANGRVDGLRNGTIVLQGFLKDFTVTKSYTEAAAGQNYGVAEVHVPMFGIKSVAARLYDSQLGVHRTLVARWKRARWPAPVQPDESGPEVLVIDARGTGFRPSMYPIFLNAKNEIVLDMITVGRDVAVNNGLCSYATTKVKSESVGSPGAPGCGPHAPATASLPGGAPGQVAGAPGAEGPTSDPASQPYKKRKRFVVRAQEAQGKDKAILVIGDKESLKLLSDPGAAHLARNGRVLVVVDAAAAGLEGRTPRTEGTYAQGGN